MVKLLGKVTFNCGRYTKAMKWQHCDRPHPSDPGWAPNNEARGKEIVARGNAGRYRPVPDGWATLPDPTPSLAPFHNFPNTAMCKRSEQWTKRKRHSRSFIEARQNFMFYCISYEDRRESSLVLEPLIVCFTAPCH